MMRYEVHVAQRQGTMEEVSNAPVSTFFSYDDALDFFEELLKKNNYWSVGEFRIHEDVNGHVIVRRISLMSGVKARKLKKLQNAGVIREECPEGNRWVFSVVHSGKLPKDLQKEYDDYGYLWVTW